MLLLILFLQKLLAVLIHATQKPKPKVAFSIFPQLYFFNRLMNAVVFVN